VPTVNTWLGDGTSNSFWTAANWSANRVPNSADEVVFDGDVSDEPCNNFSPSQEEMMGMGDGSYYRISLQDGYAGTVTLGADISIHNFELTTGEMELGQYVTGITVIDTFEWAGGGTLNDTEYEGGLFLWSGCVATIAPGEENTLTTGMTFQLEDAETIEGGAFVTFSEGELLFDNNASIHVGMYCNVLDNTTTARVEKTGYSESSSGITVNAGGKYTVTYNDETGGGDWYLNNLPLNVIGGELIVRRKIDGHITGSIGQDGGSLEMTSGHVVLYATSKLYVEDGFKAWGGVVATECATVDLSYNNNIQIVSSLIDGDFDNYGASIVFNISDSTRRFEMNGNFTKVVSELYFTGNVYWYNGTFNPAVYGPGGSQYYCDAWGCDGSFTIEGYANIQPLCISEMGALTGTPVGGAQWRVIECDGTMSIANGVPYIVGDLPLTVQTWPSGQKYLKLETE
jgi:hypothetical protein